MDIEIRRLTPTLLSDFLHFFETQAHADNPDEDRCYCVCWCSADHRLPTDFSSPEKRRLLAVEYVNAGILQGYLAYADDRVVGWCNANTKADCTHCTSWLRQMPPEETAYGDEKIKSIYCFAIAPQMKRKGIAARLLERVCQDAREEGFDLVEAYPNREFISEFSDFRGPPALYSKNEFTLHQQIAGTRGDRCIVRKALT